MTNFVNLFVYTFEHVICEIFAIQKQQNFWPHVNFSNPKNNIHFVWNSNFWIILIFSNFNFHFQCFLFSKFSFLIDCEVPHESESFLAASFFAQSQISHVEPNHLSSSLPCKFLVCKLVIICDGFAFQKQRNFWSHVKLWQP